jgi:hypothetical protein
MPDPLLNKFLSWLIIISLLICLCFLCFIFIDINEIWMDMIKFEERIQNLEILMLRKMGIET